MSKNLGLLGQKIGMTQVFGDSGECISVTAVRTGPCVVLQKRTPEKDGYTALQLGFDDKPPKRTSRSLAANFGKVKTAPKRFVKEIRLEKPTDHEAGATINAQDVFKKGDHVDVVGTSKGKGFQGVMRKYHFRGFKGSHGAHEYFRHGGSLGCRLTPGRVTKGKKMPGQMGSARITSQNLLVVDVLADENLVLVRGSVPGPNGGYVVVRGR